MTSPFVPAQLNPNNLGAPTTTRTITWLEMVTNAWGPEFYAPDHDVYKWSNGRGFDSSDKGLTGIYGVIIWTDVMSEGSRPFSIVDETYGLHIALEPGS
jgi:hypothetical protein